MSETALQAPADRLAALGRALVESRRYASESSEQLSRAWRDATAALEDEQRQAAVEQVDALLAGPQAPDAGLSEEIARIVIRSHGRRRGRVEEERALAGDRG